jgi:hypothetical protein
MMRYSDIPNYMIFFLLKKENSTIFLSLHFFHRIGSFLDDWIFNNYEKNLIFHKLSELLSKAKIILCIPQIQFFANNLSFSTKNLKNKFFGIIGIVGFL